MKPLPRTFGENSLVLRTDFSDDAAWAEFCDAIQRPNEDGFQAYVECVSDSVYAGLTVEQLVAFSPKGGHNTFVFLADHTTFSDPERLILVVDLYYEPGRTFRTIPREMSAIQNNLSIANMDYADFADNVDPDGVFRGFPK